MLVSIRDFADNRNVKSDTVSAYIRKHPEIAKDVMQQGKFSFIDTESDGYELLEKKYKLPQIYPIIEDETLRQENIELKDALNEVYKKLDLIREVREEEIKKLAEYETNVKRLEDKEKELVKVEDRLNKVEEKLEQKEELLVQTKSELEATKIELEKLKNRSFLQRLFNK